MPSSPTDDPSVQALAAVLREARGERSQEAIAHEAGLNLGTYGRMERAIGDPAWGKVARVAAVIGLSMGEVGARVDAHLRNSRSGKR